MSTTSTELATRQIEVGLVSLREKCVAIVVTDQQSYVEACELVKTGRAYIKDVGFKLDPGIESARQHLDFLRGEKNKFTEPAKAVISIAEGKAESWKRSEREAAQREQDEINRKERERVDAINAKAREEARAKHQKAPEPVAAPAPIYVAPTIPKVAGIKARINWKFRIVDASKIPAAYLMPNEVKIGQFVRDSKRAGEVIPGVEAYSEDGI